VNILLVDDDSYVLEALSKTMDWGTMGIDNVYTAQSVNKARKIIEDVPIQILLCDIEMPKENGFELLKWIRSKQYIIKDILLTSYAEFKYASEAIKYGCYAYALKPVDYEELEKLIIGAVKEEKRALSLVNHDKYFEYWTSSLKSRKEQLFRDLLLNRKGYDEQKSDFSYQPEQLFLPVVIKIPVEAGNRYDDTKKEMAGWTFCNMITEVFSTDKTSVEAILFYQDDEALVIIETDYNIDTADLMVRASELFLKKINKNLEITCSIIIGTVTRFDHLQEEVSAFLILMKKKLLELGEVMLLKSYTLQPVEYKEPNFTVWENFLKDGQDQAVKKEIQKYLDWQRAASNLDRDSLKRLISSFVQLLITVMNENGTSFYQLGDSLFNAEFINLSAESVTNAKRGMEQMIDTVMYMLQGKDNDKPIVQTVKEYINFNLDQELTREFLADQVHLNQDYLARIFKKEVGESIVNYITGKRVSVAKEYLEKTNESVNSIAIKVGYDNFSYFTKIFKDRVGMTPKEYRRNYGIESKK
jgi:two-component system response regulator YesN